ncbi:MAG: OmpA family protein, partial [Pedosphaera parvula]|nr:OmpA family protein [Pedosphaera parvula]
PQPPVMKPTDGPIETAKGMEDLFEGKYIKDASFFGPNTVYFDFDRSTVRAGERVKVEEVALYLKGDGNVKLLVEGHCDERGTEEYNRALGERRALSLREYLVNLGIGPGRIYTISYGEDQPAVPGHSEAAWAKNRRGSFVLLKPKQ